jgi:uncharacterized membrane protein
MASLRTAGRWGIDRSVPAAVAASALAVVVLLAGPMALGQRPSHRFLLWNLALAWIPFVAALALETLADGRRRLATLGSALVWLVFLPNAPYLVSDISHLDSGSTTPWLDLARLVSFAWAGCLLAVLSLRAVHRVVLRRAGTTVAWVVVVVATIGSGFGVVLGRFSRLNSWEVVTAPRAVVAEVAGLVDDRRSLAVSLFFGLLLLTIYAAVGAPSKGEAARRRW